jgi:DNA replication licensing factor MCM2
VFKTVIEANYILKPQDAYESFRLTDADEKLIRDLAKDPAIGDKVCTIH